VRVHKKKPFKKYENIRISPIGEKNHHRGWSRYERRSGEENKKGKKRP